MGKAFIEKEIEIHASPSRVWDVLVKREYVNKWAKEFSEGSVVTADWEMGGKVEMTEDNGDVVMRGEITDFKPSELLKIEFEDSEYSEVLRISTKDRTTFLYAEAGPLGEAEYEEHALLWDKGLGKIKQLSEEE